MPWSLYHDLYHDFVGTDVESVMARTKALTPSAIDNLTKGQLRDSQTAGLSIEILPSGKKVWKFARRVSGDGTLVRLSLGQFPMHTIAAAREWAGKLNEQVEVGIDPRAALREEEARATMTVDRAHGRHDSLRFRSVNARITDATVSAT